MAITTEELVAAVSPRIGDLGAAFYFIPETLARGKELGLDGFRFYFLGRGGVLGHANAATVHSAFGYFSPSLISKMWDSAAQKVEPTRAAEEYFEACAELGRAKLAGLDLAAFCSAAERVIDSADAAGLTLFAGIRTLPRAEDVPGRALQLVAVLRELRGSAHLVAVRATGLQSHTAHFIKRPADIESFGHPKDSVETVTEEDRAKLRLAEDLTDQMVVTAYAVLDDAGRQALADGIEAIAAALHPAG